MNLFQLPCFVITVSWLFVPLAHCNNNNTHCNNKLKTLTYIETKIKQMFYVNN